jgi:6-phosphogluconate dehydrogenase
MGATKSVGVIGLGVMGRNLALNIERNGFPVAGYDIDADKSRESRAAFAGKRMAVAATLEEFLGELERPRRILIMVPAGRPVDAVIGDLRPKLGEGDVLIDGGNSFFEDTRRRSRELGETGILYVGAGVSGGEEGALRGPSIMPGGDPGAWIGEAYWLLRAVLGLSPAEMHDVFAEWNKGELDSYLIEITAAILARQDPDTGKPLVDVILDTAEQKGTGKWTSATALDLGVPAQTIATAVFARMMSALKTERVAASKVLTGPDAKLRGDRKAFVANIRHALYASKICSYAQGFQLLKAANEHYGWSLDFGTIASLWRAGCIIRARFLSKIQEAYDRDAALPSLLLDPYFVAAIQEAAPGWRKVVAAAAEMGVPVPAFSSALAYYDSYRSAVLPANLLQAQRDFFGAHTYRRVDRAGVFHTNWGG